MLGLDTTNSGTDEASRNWYIWRLKILVKGIEFLLYVANNTDRDSCSN